MSLLAMLGRSLPLIQWRAQWVPSHTSRNHSVGKLLNPSRPCENTVLQRCRLSTRSSFYVSFLSGNSMEKGLFDAVHEIIS